MTDSNPIREVVHDLRNRLSAIASATTAIHKSNFDPKLSPEMIEVIQSNIVQATQSLVQLDSLGSNGQS